MLMKLCGFLHDIQHFLTHNRLFFTNSMLCFPPHYVSWHHVTTYDTISMLSWWQVMYGDNLPVWPPSLNCAGCWPLTQLQLSVLTAVLRVLVPVSWEPGPGYTGLHRSELLQSLQQAAAVRDLAEGGIIVKNAVSNNYCIKKTYFFLLISQLQKKYKRIKYIIQFRKCLKVNTPVSQFGLDIVTIVAQMVTTSTDPVMIKLPKICLLKLGRQR